MDGNNYSKPLDAVDLIDDDRNNETVEEFLLRVRGPKHLPLNVVIPITVVYVAIFVTGVLGNVAVCMVIVKNISLHTATNYYLFSLAVSDLTLLLLGLPNDLSVYWQQYPWIFGEDLCKLRALVSEMTSYTSVLTIVAFSMERYLAICHPLHSYAMSGLRRAIRIIGALWIIGFISATPFAIYTTVNYVDFPIDSGNIVYESAFCAMLENNLPPNLPIYELSFILFFLVPMIVIIILYIRIGWRIRNRTRHSLGKRVEGAIHGETKQSQSRKSIIRMLAAVVIAFFLCWAPFHAQRLLYIYASDSPYYSEVNEWMYYIAGCFYYFSSTINPILYNVMSVRYRIAFRKTLCGYSGYSRARGFSPDAHSSFRETLKTTNGSSRLQRTLTWRQASKRSIKSNATDVLVMIAPVSTTPGNGAGPVVELHPSWKQTLLRVTVGGGGGDDSKSLPDDNNTNDRQLPSNNDDEGSRSIAETAKATIAVSSYPFPSPSLVKTRLDDVGPIIRTDENDDTHC